jgi:predicted outer membrane repeat protein
MIYPFRSTNVLIDSCHFEGNTNATGFAAAIFNWNCVDIVISNSEFINNTATNAGAININGSELTGVGADNLIIENCSFEGNSVTDFGGGSIYNSAGDCTVSNCSFKGGQANNGTHIFNTAGGRNIIIENTSFEDAVGAGWGGSLTCYGLDANYQITGCSFKNNQTANLGGAVNNGFAAKVTFEDCLFENNSSLSSAGGALALQNDSTSVTVLNCEFNGNTASTSGGAIFSGASESSGILAVDGSTFLANSASIGGAIYQSEAGNDDISTLTLSNSIFGLNGANSQGGAINIGDAYATITSCLFFKNSAADTGTGGAISNNVSDSNTVVVNIVNCTFAQNSGLLAAGIANWTGTSEVSSDLNLQNNIFWQEGAINYATEAGTPVITSLGGNLSDDFSMETFLTHPKDINGEEATFVDPDDYDYHLTDGSVGVNDGVAAGAPATDLEGNPRKDQVDMGAYENQTALAAGEKLVANNGMLKLWPNPATGATTQLRLENNWKGNLQLRITDITGKVALTQSITKSGELFTMQMPLTLPTGLYTVQVSNGQEVVAEKLLRL